MARPRSAGPAQDLAPRPVFQQVVEHVLHAGELPGDGTAQTFVVAQLLRLAPLDDLTGTIDRPRIRSGGFPTSGQLPYVVSA
jgi:hypothetical protein